MQCSEGCSNSEANTNANKMIWKLPQRLAHIATGSTAKPTSQQASKPIRVLPSHQAGNQEARNCQRGQRHGRSRGGELVCWCCHGFIILWLQKIDKCPFHVFWKILISYPWFWRFHLIYFHHVLVPVFSQFDKEWTFTDMSKQNIQMVSNIFRLPDFENNVFFWTRSQMFVYFKKYFGIT